MAKDSSLPESLRKNTNDRAAMVLRALLSNIPIAGGALVELINEVIPNQRDERLRKYVVGLARRLEEMERGDELRNLGAEKIALFEDGATGSVRATTDQRIRHLVDLVSVGICNNDRGAEDQRSIVRLLNELTEADLRYLMLSTSKYGGDKSWREENGFVWSADPPHKPSPDENIAEMYIQGRLVSMGLMRLAYEVRRDSHRGSRRWHDEDETDERLKVEIDTMEMEPNGLAFLRKLGLLDANEK